MSSHAFYPGECPHSGMLVSWKLRQGAGLVEATCACGITFSKPGDSRSYNAPLPSHARGPK